jgi:2-amino-4-hydroxy-6-hydroxymethyldihydropteridine diphosphokinase
MVIEIDTDGVEAHELLAFLKKTEREIGRVDTFRWGPRTIDIDIIYIEDVNIHTLDLTVPHKELLNRNFVLIPLSDLIEYLYIDGRKVFLKKCIEQSQDSVELYISREEIGF